MPTRSLFEPAAMRCRRAVPVTLVRPSSILAADIVRNAGDTTVMDMHDHDLDVAALALFEASLACERTRALRDHHHPRPEIVRAHRIAVERAARDIETLHLLRLDAEFARN